MSLVHRRRAEAVLRRSEVDALVATTPPNLRYLLDWQAPSMSRTPRGDRHWAVLPADPTQPIGVVAPAYDLHDALPSHFAAFEVRAIGTPPSASGLSTMVAAPSDERQSDFRRQCFSDVGRALGDLFDALGLVGKRLAFDDPAAALALDADGVLVGRPTGADLFRRIRAVKTTAEIERLRASAEANSVALLAAVAVAEPRRPWRDVADSWRREMVSAGASEVHWNSFLADRYDPADRLLARHDPLGIFVAGAVEGYWSELGRVAIVGDRLPKVDRGANALATAFEAFLPSLQPGTSIEELVTAATAAREAAGLPDDPAPSVHGIGVERAELPAAGLPSENVLEPGNVVVVAFTLHEPGWAVLTVAEPVLVTTTGPRRLTSLSLDLLVTRG